MEKHKQKMAMYLVAAFAAGALLVGVTVFGGSVLQGNLTNQFLPAGKQPCGMTACQVQANEKKDFDYLNKALTETNNRIQKINNTFGAALTSVSNQLKALGQPGL